MVKMLLARMTLIRLLNLIHRYHVARLGAAQLPMGAQLRLMMRQVFPQVKPVTVKPVAVTTVRFQGHTPKKPVT
jgi:hypothetical protein